MADPQQAVSYLFLLNAAIALIMAIFGIAVHRLFAGLDRLRQVDDALAEKVAGLSSQMVDRRSFDTLGQKVIELSSHMIDRSAFNQHVEREEAALDKVHAQMAAVTEAMVAVRVAMAALQTTVSALHAQQQVVLNGKVGN